MTDIPIVTDMRELPKTYWGYTSFDKMPNRQKAETLREKYRSDWRHNPGAVCFFCRAFGKIELLRG